MDIEMLSTIFDYFIPAIVVAVIAIIYGLLFGKDLEDKLHKAETAEENLAKIIKSLVWGLLIFFFLITMLDFFEIDLARMLNFWH